MQANATDVLGRMTARCIRYTHLVRAVIECADYNYGLHTGRKGKPRLSAGAHCTTHADATERNGTHTGCKPNRAELRISCDRSGPADAAVVGGSPSVSSRWKLGITNLAEPFVINRGRRTISGLLLMLCAEACANAGIGEAHAPDRGASLRRDPAIAVYWIMNVFGLCAKTASKCEAAAINRNCAQLRQCSARKHTV
jgi:hypothetical protein